MIEKTGEKTLTTLSPIVMLSKNNSSDVDFRQDSNKKNVFFILFFFECAICGVCLIIIDLMIQLFVPLFIHKFIESFSCLFIHSFFGIFTINYKRSNVTPQKTSQPTCLPSKLLLAPTSPSSSSSSSKESRAVSNIYQ